MITKAKITQIKSLAAKAERNAQHLFVAEGSKLVEELLGSTLRVREVYVLEEICDSLPHFDNIYTITPKDMGRISHLKTPSNALALVEIPTFQLDVEKLANSLTLALDDIQDPGNLGTIIRLCDWFGIEDILCSPATVDCFNPKVVQATMGAISRLRVHYTDLPKVLGELAQKVDIYGTFLEGENIYNATLSKNGVIVMGNEGRGISNEVSRLISEKLHIPPFPASNRTTESLNVATATAVVCSEFRRR